MKTIHAQLARSTAWWEARATHSEHPIVAASGISPRLWRLYAQAWLVCLLFPIISLIELRPTPQSQIIALGGLVLFAACYTAVMWLHPLHAGARERWSPRRSLALVVGLVALALALSIAYGSAFLWLLVGASAVAGVLLPARSAFVAVMVLTLLTLGSAVGIAGSIGAADWLHILPLVLLVRGLGLDMAGLARLASALREVHGARSELARLAVIEERLRMARDLHDLLGQTLSTITLKSELATRLASQEPARAAQEMREVEHAARQAMREVRAAVAGYRQPTLQGELDGARQLLAAAGIELTIEQPAEALPAALDGALAWAVREGVTNLIRHSRARWCRIEIVSAGGIAAAELTNDGFSAAVPGCHEAGSGLAGLAERVAPYGGQVAANPVLVGGQACFRLRVRLPFSGGGAEARL